MGKPHSDGVTPFRQGITKLVGMNSIILVAQKRSAIAIAW